MQAETITHNSLKLLAESGTIRAATAIAEGDCWSLIVRYGRSEKTLMSKNGNVRIWRKLDTLAKYITKDLGIARFETDGSDFEPGMKSLKRPDSATALKKAHEASAHDKWFKEEVQKGIKEADNINTQWTSQDEVFEQSRIRLEAKINA